MKLTIPTAHLVKALSTLAPLARGNRLPILDNVLIRTTDDGRLAISATNLDIYATTYPTGAKITTPGAITCRLRPVLELLKAAQSTDSTLDDIHITLGATTYPHVAPLPPADFVPIPDLGKETAHWSPHSSDLYAGLAQCAPFQSDEPSRFILNGVCLDLPKNRLISSDGRRLALFQISGCGSTTPARPVLPSAAVKFLLPLLKRQSGAVFIEHNQEKLRVILPDGTAITTTLIQGEFPDVDPVLPKNKELRPAVLIPRVACLAAVARIRALMPKKIKENLNSIHDESHLWAIKPDTRSGALALNQETLPLPAGAPTLKHPLALRADYLETILETHNAPTLQLHVKDECSAVGFTATDNPLAVWLSPMRIPATTK